MKIAIIGPVVSSKNFGGVAVFDEALLNAFIESNDDVHIFTREKGKKNSRINIINSRSRLFDFIRIRKAVKKYNPDLIISSLDYGIIVIGYHKGIKIHYLHGFTSLGYYSKIKFLIMMIIDKIYAKDFDYLVSNSSFTKLINKDIFDTRVDKVIPIGLEPSFFEVTNTVNREQKDIDMLFVGRLVEAKHVDLLIKAVGRSSRKLSVVIIGEGPEAEYLKKLATTLGINVNFLGRKNREQLFEYYSRSKVFVSLNEHEPFGMVYLEALYFSCKIVCPNSGGQIDIANDFKEFFFTTNIDEIKKISVSLEKAMDSKFENVDRNKIKKLYSYKRVSDSLKKVIGDPNQ